MFRHVLVKYADRGLVSGGQVSPLYGQLYLTATIAITTFSCVVVEARHFRPYTEAQPAMLKYISIYFLKVFSCERSSSRI